MTTTDMDHHRRRPGAPRPALFAGVLFLVAPLAACSDSTSPDQRPQPTNLGNVQCDLNSQFIADGGVGRDGIPSLENPTFVGKEDQQAIGYLQPDDRVIGLQIDGQAYAIPHNILWWHEIVNLDLGGKAVAVTYCPLTGSSLGFDRSSIGGDELGVSGLLFQNNLIMFNRGDPEGLFPQMLAEARCGQPQGQRLEQWPVVEMTWNGWRSLHPDTRVVSGDTGVPRDYTQYPYGDYESLSSNTFLFNGAMPTLDFRRKVKERVVGVPPTGADPGIAFPFLVLTGLDGDAQAVTFNYDGEPAVLLWNDAFQGGMAFRPRTTDGQEVTLEADGRSFVDQETGSRWSVDGRATEGELSGAELVPLERAYVAFWGAWAAFFPNTRLWSSTGGG